MHLQHQILSLSVYQHVIFTAYLVYYVPRISLYQVLQYLR